jgi:hypothetical protein
MHFWMLHCFLQGQVAQGSAAAAAAGSAGASSSSAAATPSAADSIPDYADEPTLSEDLEDIPELRPRQPLAVAAVPAYG